MASAALTFTQFWSKLLSQQIFILWGLFCSFDVIRILHLKLFHPRWKFILRWSSSQGRKFSHFSFYLIRLVASARLQSNSTVSSSWLIYTCSNIKIWDWESPFWNFFFMPDWIDCSSKFSIDPSSYFCPSRLRIKAESKYVRRNITLTRSS